MIEEIGVVSAVTQHQSEQVIWVETQVKSTCGSCEAQKNCGTGAIAKVFTNKKEALSFHYDQIVAVGQKVKLGIPEESLLKASLLVYMLPLLVLTLSVLLAQSLLPVLGLNAEFWSIAFALVSSAATFGLVSRYLNSGKAAEYRPHIICVLPNEDDLIEVKQVS